jgi:DNA-binding phage protein
VLLQLAQAFGGVQAVAEQVHLDPTQIYRTLSPKGKMGLRLSVKLVGCLEPARTG